MLNSFKTYGVFLVIALIAAAVLLSNEAGVNLTHHHNLPQLSSESISCSGIFNKTCHIRLSTIIGNPEKYQKVLRTISSGKEGDTIYIHLIGNGGQVRTIVQMNNVIRASKAKIVTVVEGDVYSAHAYIAMMGDEIIIGDNVTFLVHATSAYGQSEEYCKRYKNKDGTHKLDRTQSAYDKCIEYFKVTTAQSQKFMAGLFHKVLTTEELHKALAGHDVMVTGEQVKKRLKEGVTNNE